MASISSTFSQTSPNTIDDQYDGFELTEFDQNILQEFLHEPDEGFESKIRTRMDETGPITKPNFLDWCVDSFEADVTNQLWLEMIEEITVPYDDVGTWFEIKDREMVQFETNLEMEDNPLINISGAVSDHEVEYIGFRQENA